MKKIVLVVGTRPEVIKMAPVYRELATSKTLQAVLLSTGQHREMLDQAFAAFGIAPDHDLQLMQPGQSLPELTSRVIVAVSQFLEQQQADAILVQGDTATVLAASIAAAFARVPIGHVEAGLRTYNMEHPFPEEMNRRLTSPLARWSFVPTETSRDNLLSERIDPSTIHVTGNSVIDALFWMRDKVRNEVSDGAQIAQALEIPPDFYQRFMATAGKKWLLVTGHRRESFGDGFLSICEAILELAQRHPEVGILYPVHLNPQVRQPVNQRLANHPQIALIQPVGYQQFIWLMDRCHFLLSDSGGVQEEAPSLGKPVLVMRSTTERPEGVTAGTCRLVGTDKATIIREADLLLSDEKEYRRRSGLANPYGDGRTSQRIREILEASFQ